MTYAPLPSQRNLIETECRSLPKRSRKFISISSIVTCIVLLSSCSWEEFIQRTTTEVHVNVPTYRLNSTGTAYDSTGLGCGNFDPTTRTIVLNDDSLCVRPGYIKEHEEGHAIAIAIGLDFPRSNLNQEYAADCLAAVRGYPDGSYWHCPEWAIDYTKQLLANSFIGG
jgi:hypothetical protein